MFLSFLDVRSNCLTYYAVKSLIRVVDLVNKTRGKITLETSEEDCKTTLETGEKWAFKTSNTKTTLVSSGEDVPPSECKITQTVSKTTQVQLKKSHLSCSPSPLVCDYRFGNFHTEEVWNGVLHGAGFFFSFFASMYLLYISYNFKNPDIFYSCLVYCFAVNTLFIVSTLYHSFYLLETVSWIFQVKLTVVLDY